jgi:hypothetical protein
MRDTLMAVTFVIVVVALYLGLIQATVWLWEWSESWLARRYWRGKSKTHGH